MQKHPINDLASFMEETKDDDVSEKNESAIRREKLGSIEFKDTSYRYPGADVDTLKGILILKLMKERR